MTLEHHKFTKDFPDFRDEIHQLKLKNPEFSSLMKAYDEIDDEVYRIEQGIETPSDTYTEALKLKRVELKDKLYSIVKTYAESREYSGSPEFG